MDKDKIIKVSVPVLRRMPLYHFYLTDLVNNQGMEYVSATKVADHFNFDPITVRKDLAITGEVGKPKIGFHIKSLLLKIEAFLGWGKLDEVILIGCGDLGSALMGYEGFARYGLKIIAAFDINPEKVNTEIHGTKVLHVDKLTNVCQRMGIEIAILTVPSQSAQKVTDMLVKGGIKGIWNFTPTALKVPEGIVVQQQSMAGSLAVLIKTVRHNKLHNIGKLQF